MPTKRLAAGSRRDRYGQQRGGSPGFRRALAAVIAGELRALARQRVGQVIDAAAVREVLAQLDIRLLRRDAAAEVAIAAGRRTARRLAGRRDSLAELLDADLLAEIEATIDAGLEMSERGRDALAALMEREFVRGLFTDLIFTALVSFQRKANPLFGGLAVRALEEQIKSFIGLFMPMLQAQAIAFALDRANQRAVLDFARAVARQLLATPIGRYAGAATGASGDAVAALLRHAAANDRLAALARRAAVTAWDDLFAVLKSRRIGDLLRLDEHADWLAARIAAALLPLLQRPAIAAFIADEVDAFAAPPAPRPRRRR
jgi:hypothetical protein